MKLLFVLAAILVSGLFDGTEAAHSEHSVDCLKALEPEFSKFVIPSEISELGDYIRSLNPQFEGYTLNELISDGRTEKDIQKAGFVGGAEQDPIFATCGKFVEDVFKIFGNSECSAHFLEDEIDRHASSKREDALKQYPVIDDALAYVKICLTI